MLNPGVVRIFAHCPSPPHLFTSSPPHLFITSRRVLHHLLAGPFGNVAHRAEAAARHDGEAVANAEELGQVAAYEEDRLSLGGQFADESIDFGLAAEID